MKSFSKASCYTLTNRVDIQASNKEAKEGGLHHRIPDTALLQNIVPFAIDEQVINVHPLRLLNFAGVMVQQKSHKLKDPKSWFLVLLKIGHLFL